MILLTLPLRRPLCSITAGIKLFLDLGSASAGDMDMVTISVLLSFPYFKHCPQKTSECPGNCCHLTYCLLHPKVVEKCVPILVIEEKIIANFPLLKQHFFSKLIEKILISGLFPQPLPITPTIAFPLVQQVVIKNSYNSLTGAIYKLDVDKLGADVSERKKQFSFEKHMLYFMYYQNKLSGLLKKQVVQCNVHSHRINPE